MKIKLSEAAWYKPTPNYQHQWTQSRNQWMLTRSLIASLQLYPLSKYPVLFLDFMKLSGHENIKKFADEFGLLTEGEQVDSRALIGESLHLWENEVQSMNSVWNKWQVICKKQPIPMLSTMRITSRKGTRIPSPKEIIPIYIGSIRKKINSRLPATITPMLVWNQGDKKLSLHYTTKNLLGYLWIQLAEAIDGNKQFHFCEFCGEPQEIGGRGDFKYKVGTKWCSDSCRAKAYRKNQRDKALLALNSKHKPAAKAAKTVSKRGKH